MGDDAARRKLAGYLRAVLSLPAGAEAASLPPLSPCSLSACGAVPLAPLPDDGPLPRSKWRACGGGGSVVRQLRALLAQRCVGAEGRVLRVATRRGWRGRWPPGQDGSSRSPAPPPPPRSSSTSVATGMLGMLCLLLTGVLMTIHTVMTSIFGAAVMDMSLVVRSIRYHLYRIARSHLTCMKSSKLYLVLGWIRGCRYKNNTK